MGQCMGWKCPECEELSNDHRQQWVGRAWGGSIKSPCYGGLKQEVVKFCLLKLRTARCALYVYVLQAVVRAIFPAYGMGGDKSSVVKKKILVKKIFRGRFFRSYFKGLGFFGGGWYIHVFGRIRCALIVPHRQKFGRRGFWQDQLGLVGKIWKIQFVQNKKTRSGVVLGGYYQYRFQVISCDMSFPHIPDLTTTTSCRGRNFTLW